MPRVSEAIQGRWRIYSDVQSHGDVHHYHPLHQGGIVTTEDPPVIIEKPLHKKKISELEWKDAIGEIITSTRRIPLDHPKNTDMIYINTLRSWAIAYVKNCHHNKWNRNNWINNGGACLICSFLMDKFELKEEELK
jgi:hypothetical protein